MGSDHGPEEIVRGAVLAIQKHKLSIILVGDQAEIDLCLKKIKEENSAQSLNLSSLEVVHVPDYIRMEDSPSMAIRSREPVSVRVAYELVREGKACAVISPGNTGAMLAAGMHVVGIVENISRPAIATMIPRAQKTVDEDLSALEFPTILIDSGANVQASVEHLLHFAVMGKCYHQALFKTVEPKIALLSNGTEASKGNELVKNAAKLMQNTRTMNYVGYVEGGDIPTSTADVVSCDGFLGNIVLKSMEGSVKLVVNTLKELSKGNLRTKLGLWLAKPALKQVFQEKLDPATFGGAPLLGLNCIGIVCHGSSNAKAVTNALKLASDLDKAQIITTINEELSRMARSFEVHDDGMWNKLTGKLHFKKKTKENNLQ